MRHLTLFLFLVFASSYFGQKTDTTVVVVGVDTSLGRTKIVPAHKFLVRIDSLKNNYFALKYNWLYSAKSDPAFSGQYLDDSKWDTLNTELYQESLQRSGFKGECWFRIHFLPDSSLAKIPLALKISQEGASQIYLNGKLISELGVVSSDRKKEVMDNGSFEGIFILPEFGKENVLAVHFSNTHYEHSYDKLGMQHAGFDLSVCSSEELYSSSVGSAFFSTGAGLGMFIFFATMGLIHFLLWIFYRARRSNLFFTLFCLLLGYYFFHAFYATIASDPILIDFMNLFIIISIPLFFVAILAVLYSVFYEKFPKQLWIFLGSGLIISTLVVFHVNVGTLCVGFMILASMIETLRIIIVAIRKKKKGSKIIGTGFGFFALFLLCMIIIIFATGGFTLKENSAPAIIFFTLVLLSILSLPLSMSVFLAWDFAATNKTLKSKLAEVEELSTKNIEHEKEKQRILESQKETLEAQVVERTQEIHEQKKEIEEKNKDITDSINYAQRIQKSILPTEEERAKLFPESFLLFRPRDIVSGDFFWMDKIGTDLRIMIVADCTGHGVPGALMSMIGCNLLQKIITERKITSPAEILCDLHKEVRKVLKQQSGSDSNDGMDMAVCVVDGEKLCYGGAQRPMLLLRSSGEMEEVKASKHAIGGAQANEELHFEQHEFLLKDVSAFYIFSDGFADQFGGPKGKKFKFKQLSDTLLKNSGLPMTKQKDELEKKFLDWKGTLEQIDDVCVVGVRM